MLLFWSKSEYADVFTGHRLMMLSSPVLIRPALADDVAALYALELASFASDRLSLRRFRHWVQADNAVLRVALLDNQLAAYGLVLLHKGTRLARLYSIAVDDAARGHGVARSLLMALEQAASDKGRIFMRLEVASDNKPAIRLYESLGYSIFGIYNDYYEGHKDALRMQKRIRYVSENLVRQSVPWYQQTTEFTCGPAALMMAMASLDSAVMLEQRLELDIWREATTVFMTRGHGGCHPVGLGLAAKKRGFEAMVYLNQRTPLFVEGVRHPEKKDVLRLVDRQFREQASEQGLPVCIEDVSHRHIEHWLQQGAAVLVLISTYRMDSRKAPHWVTVTAMDEQCFYVHDPDPDNNQNALDCQYLPIARGDFDKMSLFGKEKLRTAVVLKKACC